MHELKREVDRQLVYHERWLPPISVLFNADFRLSSLHDAVAATREELGNERMDPSPGGIFVLTPKVTGDLEGDRDFGDMSSGPTSGREQGCIVLRNIQALVNRAGLLAPDNSLDALQLG